MKKYFVPVFMVLALASLSLLCSSKELNGQPAPVVETPQGKAVTINWSVSHANGGQVRSFRVVSNADELTAIGKQLNHEINPETEILLIAAMGRRNTGGYGITINSVRELPDRLTAYITENSPGPNDMVTMAITSPIAYAVIARSEKMVYFNVNNQLFMPEPQQSCGNFSKPEKLTTLVARTEAEAREIYGLIGQQVMAVNGEAPAVEIPKIDFNTQMVIAVFIGQVRGGTSVRISSIITNEDGLQVLYVITPPDPRAFGADVMVSPYAVAIIPANKAEVFFTEQAAKNFQLETQKDKEYPDKR